MEKTIVSKILDGKIASEAILNDVRSKIDNHIKSESRYIMSQECYEDYHSVENKRERELNKLLK